jgi:hypothetical protein
LKGIGCGGQLRGGLGQDSFLFRGKRTDRLIAKARAAGRGIYPNRTAGLCGLATDRTAGLIIATISTSVSAARASCAASTARQSA